MTVDFESRFGGDSFNRFLHGAYLEFLRLTAIGANQVPVLASIHSSFEAGSSVPEIHFGGQAALGKKPQRSIHSRKTDFGILFPDQGMKLIGGKMPFGGKELVEDENTLGGLLQAFLLQIISENLVLFFHLAANLSSLKFAHDTDTQNHCKQNR